VRQNCVVFCRSYRAHVLSTPNQGLRASRSPRATICRACGALAPGYHLPRLRRSRPWLPSAAPAALTPLATICRACGAHAPGYQLPRLRRSRPGASICRACGALSTMFTPELMM
jgi:ribosomal protein L40E